MSVGRLPPLVDELEQLSIEQSRERFGELRGEVSADAGLIMADGMLYAVGIIAVLSAIFEIAYGAMPTQWHWDSVDLLLLGCGAGLWICSQSLNNFKRLLPLWLRLVLRMELGPIAWSDQSQGARKRRALTLLIGAVFAFIVGWRFSEAEALATRIGIPFHLVIWGLGVGLVLLGVRWLKLLGKEESIVVFE